MRRDVGVVQKCRAKWPSRSCLNRGKQGATDDKNDDTGILVRHGTDTVCSM